MKNNYRVVPERTPEEEKSYKEISKILDTLRKIQSGELVCVRKKIDTKMKELSTGIDMAELGILDDDNPRIEVDWHLSEWF